MLILVSVRYSQFIKGFPLQENQVPWKMYYSRECIRSRLDMLYMVQVQYSSIQPVMVSMVLHWILHSESFFFHIRILGFLKNQKFIASMKEIINTGILV